MTALSLCVGMGLLDRAFLDHGFQVTPGCEIHDARRALYLQLCGGKPLHRDIHDLIAALQSSPTRYEGVIGGPPCQSLTSLKSFRDPKYPDLTDAVKEVLSLVRPDWYLLENVRPLDIPGAVHSKVDAMHYGHPHQSRPRWFTHSPNLAPPAKRYHGNMVSLRAYPVVAGKIYGLPMAAWLQGYPEAAGLKGRARDIVEGLANAVSYPVALAWAQQIQRVRNPLLFQEAA